MRPLMGVAVALAAGVAAATPAGAARLRWFGQACFEVVSNSGTRVVIDPFGASVGYAVPELEADLVLITHEHGDHNNAAAVKGDPVVLHGLQMNEETREVRGIQVRAVRTDHDAEGGAKRGKNTLFVLKLDGLVFAHCGDLGHVLTPAQVKAVGKVDVLMLPVGGYYTIDAKAAARVVKQLEPRLVIPMHFKTEATPKLPIADPLPFLDAAKEAGWTLRHAGSSRFSVERARLPQQTTVVVLDYR